MLGKRRFKCLGLFSDYAIDQALLDEDGKIVILKFGWSEDFENSKFYSKLIKVISKLRKFFIFYFIDTKKVVGFNLMYEVFRNPAFIFFFKNKKILIDHGTGNNNKIEKISFCSKELSKIVRRYIPKHSER